MKLIDLYEEVLKEAYTAADLKNLGGKIGSKIKQGVVNAANKPLNVDFSGKKGQGNTAQSKIETLGAEVGFNIPLTLRRDSVKKALGPFTDLLNTGTLTSYLKIDNNDMNKIRALKPCFGKDFVERVYGVIQLNNWIKHAGFNNDYVYEYKKLDHSILYYSKKNHPTYFYLEKGIQCYNGGENLESDDITILQNLFNLPDIQSDDFKKIEINITDTR